LLDLEKFVLTDLIMNINLKCIFLQKLQIRMLFLSLSISFILDLWYKFVESKNFW